MRVSKSGFTALAALTSVLFQACTLPGDNPTPYLTSATPNLIYAGSPATVITLDGAAFLPSSQGRWEGSNRVTTYINSNQITVELTAADVALGAKTRPLVVENPPPGGGTAAISITIGYPKPHITQVSPASGSKAAGSFMITITGTGFVFLSSSQIDNTGLATSYLGPTELRATVNPSDFTVGTHWLKVTTTGPGGGADSTQVTINP